ncbi:MAG: hypothetical protein L6R38_006805 [Xanthoria sp. 2 TBL-2021]|nr:MAG: hypothetical protein L6R38_006805 [Xanthoria sp. 2 TBL-2021]
MKLSAIAFTLLPLVADAYKGDMTYYEPGLGSCGHNDPPSAKRDVVALSREMMNNGPNPNNNPKCGSKINIYNPSTKKTHTATIVDTCWACKKEDIDVNVELFNKVAPNGDGRVHGIMWNGEKVGGGKLPGSKGLVVQDGGWELENVDEDGLWELKGVDEDVDVLSAAELEVKHAGVEQELKMVQAEIVREKGCMGKVSRVMRQYWQMWA